MPALPDLVARLRLDTTDLDGGLTKAKGSLSGIGTTLKAVGGAFAAAFAVNGIKAAISGASDLEGAVSRVNTIFGSATPVIQAFGNTAAQAVGLSKQEALAAAAGFGNMFTQIGFAQGEAAKLSTGVVTLAADLGAFNDLPTADVADRISAAFRGEFDSLQTLIPTINAAAVESEALTATGKKSASQLTAQEKATATLAIIQREGTAAAGAFRKESDSLSGSQKILSAQVSDLTTRLGSALVPILSTAVSGVVRAIEVFDGLSGGVKVAIGAVVGLAAGGLVLAKAIETVKTLSAAYTAVQAALNFVLSANPIGLIVIGLAALAAGLVIAYQRSETFRNIVNGAFSQIVGAARGVIGAIEAIGGAIGRVIGMVGGLVSAIGRIKFPSIPKIPGFAHGVNNFGGGLAVVGERGPELVRLPRGSDVIPNHRLAAGSVSGGGTDLTPLIAEVRGLRADNEALRAEVRRQTDRHVLLTRTA